MAAAFGEEREVGRKGKRLQLVGGWTRATESWWGGAGQIWSGSCLPTLNSVDLADGIADSATEAGQPGCSLLHLGHGVLDPGLKAGQDTRPLTFHPTSSPGLDLL